MGRAVLLCMLRGVARWFEGGWRRGIPREVELYYCEFDVWKMLFRRGWKDPLKLAMLKGSAKFTFSVICVFHKCFVLFFLANYNKILIILN